MGCMGDRMALRYSSTTLGQCSGYCWLAVTRMVRAWCMGCEMALWRISVGNECRGASAHSRATRYARLAHGWQCGILQSIVKAVRQVPVVCRGRAVLPDRGRILRIC